MSFQMPDFAIGGDGMDTTLDWARHIVTLLNNNNQLWVLAGFVLLVMIIRWIIRTVRQPPDLA